LSCDAMLISVSLFVFLQPPKPLRPLRHILRCACQERLRLPGRRHVSCRGLLLHLNS
jgi:hypothetical protein